MARRFSKKRLQEGLKVVFESLKPHRREVGILVFLSVIEALGNASVPYLAGSIIDAITSPSFLAFPIIWFFVKIITDAVANRGNALNEKLGGDVEAEYLVRGFGKILEFPLSVHKSIKTGEMTNRISRASGYVSTIITDILVRLAPQFLSIIAAFFFTALIKPALTFVLAGAVVLYIVILITGAPRLAELILKVNRAYNKAWGEAHDAILNVQSVKQATAEEYAKIPRFADPARDFRFFHLPHPRGPDDHRGARRFQRLCRASLRAIRGLGPKLAGDSKRTHNN